MAATTETVTSAKVCNRMVYGSWTSDATKGDHTITCPVNIAYFFAVLDATGTNPNILSKHIDEDADTLLIDGGPTQALATSPTDATGVTITNATGGSGTTILVDSNSMVNSGENHWWAIVKD